MATTRPTRYNLAMDRRSDQRSRIEPGLARLYRSPDFDLDLYREACAGLAKQETACASPAAHRRLIHRWFQDAFFPEHDQSALENETAIPPFSFDMATDVRFLRMPEGGMFSSWEVRQITSSPLIEGALYGDRLFTNIRSGLIVTGPPETFDLIGTGELDCCTAIAGIRKNGSVLLGHIPGPHASYLEKTLSELGKFDLETAFLIHPQLPVEGYQTPDAATRAADVNAQYERLARRHGLRDIGYASSAVAAEREPDGYFRLRTLVTVRADGVCLSLNRERARRIGPLDSQRGLRIHYTPLAIETFPW